MKIEFMLDNASGKIVALNLKTGVAMPFTPAHPAYDELYEQIRSQLPQAFEALMNKHNKVGYLIVENFILCNFIGNDERVDFDSETKVMHLESRFCSASKTKDCKFCGVICSPKRLIASDREKEILTARKEGKTFAEIADRCCISVNTVKNHIRHILKKNNKHSVTQVFNLI